METMQISSVSVPESSWIGRRPCPFVSVLSVAGFALRQRGCVAVTEPQAARGLPCFLSSPWRKTRANLDRADSQPAWRESAWGQVGIFSSHFEKRYGRRVPNWATTSEPWTFISECHIDSYYQTHRLHLAGQPHSWFSFCFTGCSFSTPVANSFCSPPQLLSVGGSQFLSRNPSAHIQPTNLYQDV